MCAKKGFFYSWFRNQKLQIKFSLILLIALLLVFLGMLVTSRITNQAYNDALYERTIQLLTLFSQNVQEELDSIGDSSFSIIADNVIQEGLTQLHKNEVGSQAWIAARKNVSNRVLNISLTHSDIVSIRLRAADGRGTEFRQTKAGDVIPNKLFKERADAAYAAKGREIWVSDETVEGTLFLMRDVREVADLTLDSIGMLVMQVDMGKIVSRCSEALSVTGMPLLCAIDLNDVCVYSSQKEIANLKMTGQDFLLLEGEEETLFCVRHKPTGSQWVYTAALPYGNIVKSVRYSSGVGTGIAVTVLAFVLLLGSRLIASILRHFQILLGKYDAFASGNLKLPTTPDPYQDRMDEIGELHRRFDQMALEHQCMIDEIYVKHQLLLEAQLHQLRGQIQPHFLYNTLESIYCLAVKADNQQIATMTGALGRLLRATLQDKRYIVTLEEDLKISKEYVDIQLIRYGDQLQVTFDVHSQFWATPIPAMTLQPLIENAVRHGAEEMLELCQIHVYCQQDGDYVDLIVEDNGLGIDEDILEKLETGEMQAEGLGIGLANIQKRIHLAFHDERCGLQFKREQEKTRVIVKLPAEVKIND
jgi:two-component system sensor histidine kinase YesM